MLKKRIIAFSAMLTSLLVACSGGGSDSSTPASASVSPVAVVKGTVVDVNAAPLANVLVTLGTTTATSNAAGEYSVSVAPNADTLSVVSFSVAGYALQTRTTQQTLAANASVVVNATLQPVAATIAFSPVSAQTLTVPGSVSQVTLAANALVRANGAAPGAQVQVEMTPLSVNTNGNVMPGLFGSSVSQPIESFGAMQVTFTDKADGAKLQLASGQSSTIRIPAVSRGGVALPASIPLYYLNETTGLWVQEGSASLMGTSPNQYYEGSVTHFSTWNADKALDTVFIKGCVKDAGGLVLSGVHVDSHGADYIGSSHVKTDSNGLFSIPVKKVSTSRLVAQQFSVPYLNSAPQDVTVGTTDVTLSQCLVVNQTGIAAAVTFPAIIPGLAAYQGNYTGTYAGVENGTFGIAVSNAGVISGSGFSSTYGIPFTVSGTVGVTGVATLSGVGSAGTAMFAGVFNATAGTVGGTWRYVSTPASQTNGTFAGNKTP